MIKFKDFYSKYRGHIVSISKLFFIPKKWRNVIVRILEVLDTVILFTTPEKEEGMVMAGRKKVVDVGEIMVKDI